MKQFSRQSMDLSGSNNVERRTHNHYVSVSCVRIQNSVYQIATLFSMYASSLILPMLRLVSSKAQWRKDFWKPSKPCHFGIHGKALDEFYQMSTHVPGFQSFFSFLRHFVTAKLATSSIMVYVMPFPKCEIWCSQIWQCSPRTSPFFKQSYFQFIIDHTEAETVSSERQINLQVTLIKYSADI